MLLGNHDMNIIFHQGFLIWLQGKYMVWISSTNSFSSLSCSKTWMWMSIDGREKVITVILLESRALSVSLDLYVFTGLVRRRWTSRLSGKNHFGTSPWMWAQVFYVHCADASKQNKAVKETGLEKKRKVRRSSCVRNVWHLMVESLVRTDSHAAR